MLKSPYNFDIKVEYLKMNFYTIFGFLSSKEIFFISLNYLNYTKIKRDEFLIFYVPLPYILHLTDSCPFSKEP